MGAREIGVVRRCLGGHLGWCDWKRYFGVEVVGSGGYLRKNFGRDGTPTYFVGSPVPSTDVGFCGIAFPRFCRTEIGAEAKGGEFFGEGGDVEVLLVELFVGEIGRLGRGIEGGELELLHVDAESEAEEAADGAGAVEGGVDGADCVFFCAVVEGMGDGAFGGIDEAFHVLRNAHAAAEEELVAFVGEPALGAKAFGGVESAVFALAGVGLPALVSLDESGDGGLVDFKLLGDPGLGFAFHFDPVVDEVVGAVGGPGAAGGGGSGRVGGGGHGWAPEKRAWLVF